MIGSPDAEPRVAPEEQPCAEPRVAPEEQARSGLSTSRSPWPCPLGGLGQTRSEELPPNQETWGGERRGTSRAGGSAGPVELGAAEPPGVTPDRRQGPLSLGTQTLEGAPLGCGFRNWHSADSEERFLSNASLRLNSPSMGGCPVNLGLGRWLSGPVFSLQETCQCQQAHVS